MIKRTSILVEHRKQDRLIRRYRTPKENLLIGGRPRTGQGRSDIVCPDSAELSAAVRYRDGVWIWQDRGGKKTAKDGRFDFGDESLSFRHLEEPPPVFVRAKSSDPGFGREAHQVVVYLKGRIVESDVLPLGREYRCRYLEKNFAAPEGFGWTVSDEGPLEIWRRRVHVPEGIVHEKSLAQKLKESRNWVLSLVIFLLSLISRFVFDSSPETPPEVPSNSYTKMIYSKDEVDQRRKEASAILKEEFNTESVAAGSKEAGGGWSSEGVQTAISDIRDSSVKTAIQSIALQATRSISGRLSREEPHESGPSKAERMARVEAGGALGAGEGPGAFKLSGVSRIGQGKVASRGGGGLQGGGVGQADVQFFEEETRIDGGLDPEVIAKVIRQHLGDVRYCYERQLSSDPDLSGKVQLKFAIKADGQVERQTIGETTLRNAMVEGCILRRVARWRFPNPKGGTTVQVTYPFVLKTLR